MTADRTPYSPPSSKVADVVATDVPATRGRPLGVWIITAYSIPWALALFGGSANQLRLDPKLFDLAPWWQLYLAFFCPALLFAASIFLFKLLKPALPLFVVHVVLAKYPYVLVIASSGGGIQNLQAAFGGRFPVMTLDFLGALIPAIYAWHLNKKGALKQFR